MKLLLGVDGGGTRSAAWVADDSGVVRGTAAGGPSNYQSIGPLAAREVLQQLTQSALEAAGATAADVAWAAYGIAGADRPCDYAAIEQQLPPLPPASRRTLVNDTQLALWAGTADGVGVALVAGTGTNAQGRHRDGTIEQLGGYGWELGDFGAASDLGREALRLAMRGHDGRGEPTALYPALCEALGVDPLVNVIDKWISEGRWAGGLGELAPLVFATAARGDAVARQLLERVGREVARSAMILGDRICAPGEPFTVVLGGSVLQRGYEVDPTICRTAARELAARRPRALLLRLVVEPVAGALLCAHAAAGLCGGPSCSFERGLRAALGTELAVPIT